MVPVETSAVDPDPSGPYIFGRSDPFLDSINFFRILFPNRTRLFDVKNMISLGNYISEGGKIP